MIHDLRGYRWSPFSWRRRRPHPRSRRTARPMSASDAAARLAIMQRSLMGFNIQPAGNRPPAFRLQPEPIFRFTNPVGTSKDGAIFLWLGESDRPEWRCRSS